MCYGRGIAILLFLVNEQNAQDTRQLAFHFGVQLPTCSLLLSEASSSRLSRAKRRHNNYYIASRSEHGSSTDP